MLIERGADIKAKTNVRMKCSSPIHCCLPISCGVHVYRILQSGTMVLHGACYNGHKDVAVMLIEKGAEIEAQAQVGIFGPIPT